MSIRLPLPLEMPAAGERKRQDRPLSTIRFGHPRLPPFRKEHERVGHPHSICDLDIYKGWATYRHSPETGSRIEFDLLVSVSTRQIPSTTHPGRPPSASANCRGEAAKQSNRQLP